MRLPCFRHRTTIFPPLGVVLATALWTVSLAAQEPIRVFDPDPTPLGGQRAEPTLGVLGDEVFYAGRSPLGVELHRVNWRTGVGAAVADLQAGPASSFPFAFTTAGNRLYFFAAGAGQGFELWAADGTGVSPVLDLAPGAASSAVPDDARPGPLCVLGNVLLFAANDGTGPALWRSDGTVAGTVRLQAFPSHPVHTAPQLRQWVVAGPYAVFLREDPQTGAFGCWQTDGTASGTRRILRFAPPATLGQHEPYTLCAVGPDVFVASEGSLWRLIPGPQNSTVQPLLANSGFGHHGFGAVLDPVTQQQRFVFSGGSDLWRSDGTQAGTMPYYPQVGLGVLNVSEQQPAVLGDTMLFYGFDLAGGEEPWITDGTTGGTRRLVDVRGGPLDSARRSRYRDSAKIVTDGQRFYFAADDGVHGLELFVSDGTVTGTRSVGDLHPGIADSLPRSLAPLPLAGLVFVADDAAGPAVWSFQAGGNLVLKLASDFEPVPEPTRPGRIAGLVAHDERLLLAARGPGSGAEPWVSDGTAAGTGLLADLHAGPGSSLRHHDLAQGPDYAPLVGVAHHGDFFFSGYEAPGQLALFRTDGRPQGTARVRGLDLLAGSGWELRGAGVGDFLLFQGYAQGQGEGMFSMASTGGAMTRLSATRLGPTLRLGNRLLYADGAPPSLGGIWSSDGTPQGTQQLITSGGFVFDPLLWTRLDRTGWVAVPGGGGALWSTDGTLAGTTRVRTARVFGLVAGHDDLFTLEQGGSGMELRRGDGTAAGTVTIAANLPQPSRDLLRVGDRLYFLGFVGGDVELWTSDGTGPGTIRLRSFRSVVGDVPSLSTALVAGSRRLFFQIQGSRTFGTELWTTDGTPAGTRVFDLWRGPLGENGDGLALVAGKVLFRAHDGRTGSVDGDLWSLDPGAVAYPGIEGCAADGFPPELRATDPVLGGSSWFDLRGLPTRPGILLLGLPLRDPTRVSSRCRLHLDPGLALTLTVATDPRGRWSTGPLPIPNQASLRGLRLVVQGGLLGAVSQPFEAAFSNSVVLVVGD